MKFEIAGSQIELETTHLIAAISVLIALNIPIAIILFAVVPNAGAVGDKSFETYNSIITGVTSVITEPVIAAAFLVGLGLYKLKKDEQACRSITVGGFIVYAAFVIILLVLAVIFAPASAAKSTLSAIITLLQGAASSFIIYLWMLIFLKTDKQRLGSIIPFAIVFAIVVFLAGRLLLYAEDYAQKIPYQFSFDISSLAVIVTWFLSGTAIMYHVKGREMNTQAAYMFAAFMLAGALVYGMVDSNGMFLGNIHRFSMLAEVVVALIILSY